MWRSLVAHFAGGEGVAGSNPVIPTIKKPANSIELAGFLDFETLLSYRYKLFAIGV